MATKSILAVLVLTFLPGAVFAQGCESRNVTQTTSQCAIGQIWDTTTQSCVTLES